MNVLKYYLQRNLFVTQNVQITLPQKCAHRHYNFPKHSGTATLNMGRAMQPEQKHHQPIFTISNLH